MKQIIEAKKKVGVADLLKLDLQFFADEPIDEPIDDSADEPIDDIPNDEDLGDKEQEPAEPVKDVSFKDDPQNQAFAQIRREKEAYEAQVRAMDAEISRMYGESHGIHTFAEFQQAAEAERQAAERQRYADAGLPDDVIDKLSKVDEVIQQAEQEKFNRLLFDNFNDLTKEYPDMVKQPDDIPGEVWQRWNDGKTGLSLTEAFELVNKQAIREHLQASAKQSTLNKVNSKSHVRGNGGEGADDVDLTSVPADVMQSYRQLFAKELRSGKMKESDFVKHYKKSQ